MQNLLNQPVQLPLFQPDATLAAEIANIGVLAIDKPVAKRGRKTVAYYDTVFNLLVKLPLGTMITLNKSFDSYETVQRFVSSLKHRTKRLDQNATFKYASEQKEGPGGSIHWAVTVWLIQE